MGGMGRGTPAGCIGWLHIDMRTHSSSHHDRGQVRHSWNKTYAFCLCCFIGQKAKREKKDQCEELDVWPSDGEICTQVLWISIASLRLPRTSYLGKYSLGHLRISSWDQQELAIVSTSSLGFAYLWPW